MRGGRRARRTRRAVLAAVGLGALVLSTACSSAIGSGKPAVVGAAGSCGTGNITLTVWTYYAGQGQTDALKEQDALFKKKCPNVTVKQVAVPGAQLDPKLLATASTHNGPDVLLNNVVVDFAQLQAAGVMADLTTAWNAFSAKDQFPSTALWRGPNNKIYSLSSYTNLLGLYYNKTILDEYHLSPPTTIDQMEDEMKTIKDGGKYTPLAESGTPEVGGAWLFMPLLLSQGVNYCNYTKKPDQVLSAFQTVDDWVQKGWLPKDAATWNQNDSWQRFMTGKYAFGLNGNWNLGDAKANAKFSWGTAQFPSTGGTDSGNKSMVFPGGEGLAIGAFTKHPDVAWQYLMTSWLSSSGSLADYSTSGQIPTRADVAASSTITSNASVTPFVAATKDVGHWPNNPKTADAQNDMGKAISSVISGQATPAKAAKTSIRAVGDDLKAGGGGC